jgi:hypothetical protein
MSEVFVLDALFDLPNLRYLIVWVRRDRSEDRVGVKEDVVDRFVEVLKEGFEERGARPRIVVEVVGVSDD